MAEANVKHSSQRKIAYFLTALIFFTIFAALYIVYSAMNYRSMLSQQADLERKAVGCVELQQSFVRNEIGSAASDLYFLLENPTFQNSVKNAEYTVLEKDWLSFMKWKPLYDRISFIDVREDGISVNRENGSLTASKSTQDGKSNTHFTDAVSLEQGKIYMLGISKSGIDKSTKLPIKPMIRFAAPVYQGEKKTGILTVNYSAERLIQTFHLLSQEQDGYTYLLNGEGDSLFGEPMGSEKENLQGYTFARRFSQEWQKILAQKSGWLYSDKGLFAFQTILTEDESLPNGSVAENPPLHLAAADSKWVLVHYVPLKTVPISKYSIITVITHTLWTEPYVLLLMVLVSGILSLLFIIYDKRRKQINQITAFDSMTGVYNRNVGLVKLRDHIEKLKYGIISVCFIDINGLKTVNDVLGHEKGDELIRRSVRVIAESIRENDYIIRLGGDEFLVCLPDATIRQAETVWERIAENVAIENKKVFEYYVSLSHGISSIRGSADKLDEIISEADAAMYHEKGLVKDNMFQVIRKKEDVYRT